MRSILLSCCLAAMLAVGLGWELTAPEPGVDAPEPAIFATHTRPATPVSDQRSSARIDADALAGVAGAITRRPLFSPGRLPPDGPAVAAAASAPGDGLPRLAGVIVGPSGGSAIFVGPDGKSRAANEGDTVGGFQVRAIGPGSVTLSGSGGDRVVRPTYIQAQDAATSAGSGPRTAIGAR